MYTAKISGGKSFCFSSLMIVRLVRANNALMMDSDLRFGSIPGAAEVCQQPTVDRPSLCKDTALDLVMLLSSSSITTPASWPITAAAFIQPTNRLGQEIHQFRR